MSKWHQGRRGRFVMILLAPISFATAQQPSITLQLPTVQTAAVGTTVSVPVGGVAGLGGLRGASSGQTGGARGTTAASSGFAVGVVLHEFDAWDDALWIQAERGHQKGQIADAITKYRELTTAPGSKYVVQARSRLTELREQGEHRFAWASQQAQRHPTVATVAEVDAILNDYGDLILTPARRQAQRQLQRLPGTVSDTAESQAKIYLAKAQAASVAGKTELAQCYWRMAAKQTGTQAAIEAQEALAASAGFPKATGPVLTRYAGGDIGNGKP